MCCCILHPTGIRTYYQNRCKRFPLEQDVQTQKILQQCMLYLCSIAKNVLLKLNSSRNINQEERLNVRHRYEQKRPFTATNHRQLNEKAGSLIFPLHSVGLQFLLLESISEHKTNLGNKNQLLEDMGCLHNHQAHTRMLLTWVRVKKVQ